MLAGELIYIEILECEVSAVRLLCGWAALYGVGDELVKKSGPHKLRKARSDTPKDEHLPEEHPEAARLSDIVHEFEAIGI